MKTKLCYLPYLQGLLGACCECGRQDRPVRHVVILPVRSPEPGPGCWGCLSCDLPQAGATAVLCDECAETFSGQPLNIVLGSPDLNRRMPFRDFEPFDHDETKHSAKVELIFGGSAPKDDLKKFIDKLERHFTNSGGGRMSFARERCNETRRKTNQRH